VAIVIRPWAEIPRYLVSFSIMVKISVFVKVQAGSKDQTASCSIGSGGFIGGKAARV
jgi:hypothetical protein